MLLSEILVTIYYEFLINHIVSEFVINDNIPFYLLNICNFNVDFNDNQIPNNIKNIVTKKFGFSYCSVSLYEHYTNYITFKELLKTIDDYSNAIDDITDNLNIAGDLIIGENESPTFEVQGNFIVNGNFSSGNSTIIMEGANSKTIGLEPSNGKSFFSNSTNAAAPTSVTLYNLTINGDSTTTNGTIIIQNKLTLNAQLSVGTHQTAKAEVMDTVFVTNSDTSAIVGNGSVENGVIKRAVGLSQNGVYRFHSPYTSIKFGGNGSYPSTMSLAKFSTQTNVGNVYLSTKNGTVDQTNKFVKVSGISNYSKWVFGQVGHKAGDQTGGPVYEISALGEQTPKNGNSTISALSAATVSLNYNPALLNGIPENQLVLLKTSSALKIKIFEDADGSNLTTTDRVAKRWTSSTYLGSVSNVNLVNTLTDTNGIVEDIGAGNFIINCIDSSGWNFIQHYSNAASTSPPILYPR